MREEQIANGVRFLVHPKVKTAPLSQRISFLENKVKQQAVSLYSQKRLLAQRCTRKQTADTLPLEPRARCAMDSNYRHACRYYPSVRRG